MLDADVGLWGGLLYAARLASLGLVGLATYGHTMAYTDHLSVAQTRAAALVLAGCAGLLVASTIKSVYLRAEDDLIGRATLPLDFLMDQKTYARPEPLAPRTADC